MTYVDNLGHRPLYYPDLHSVLTEQDGKPHLPGISYYVQLLPVAILCTLIHSDIKHVSNFYVFTYPSTVTPPNKKPNIKTILASTQILIEIIMKLC